MKYKKITFMSTVLAKKSLFFSLECSFFPWFSVAVLVSEIKKKNWVQSHANLAGIPTSRAEQMLGRITIKAVGGVNQGYWVDSEQGSERHSGEDNGPGCGTWKIQASLYQ